MLYNRPLFTNLVFFSVLFVASVIFFWPVLDVTNIDWIRGDIAQHYLGWAFYRQTEGWHFPVTFVPTLAYPFGVSIAMTDSIPLLAVPLRVIEDLLPTPFQYLGWYQLASTMLAGLMGFLIARQLGFRGPSAYLIALFFATSPVMLFRMHGHTSLTSHWVFLWTLLIFLRLPLHAFALTRPQLIQIAATVFIAALIHPYILLIVYMFVLAIGLRIWLAGGRWWVIVGQLVAAAALGIGLMILVGFIPLGQPTSVVAGGYRFFSLNLLAPINPMNYPSLVLPRLPLADRVQYEGYAYLGLGMLVLAGGAIIRAARQGAGAFPPRPIVHAYIIPLGLMSFGAVLMALSARITVGSWTVIDVPLPQMVEHALSIFRSSGRLFWPVFYLILIAVFVGLRGLSERTKAVLLAACFALQMADIRPLMQSVSRQHSTDGPVITWIRDLAPDVAGYRHIKVLRPRLCHGQDRVGGSSSFIDFSMLALETGATLNSFYSARHTWQERAYHCTEEVDRFLAGPLDRDTAYIVHADIVATVPEPRRSTECQPVGPAFLCQAGREG